MYKEKIQCDKGVANGRPSEIWRINRRWVEGRGNSLLNHRQREDVFNVRNSDRNYRVREEGASGEYWTESFSQLHVFSERGHQLEYHRLIMRLQKDQGTDITWYLLWRGILRKCPGSYASPWQKFYKQAFHESGLTLYFWAYYQAVKYNFGIKYL